MSQATLFRAPSSSRLAPRYYQEDALAGVQAGIDAGEHSQLVVMATGLGKTVVFAHLIQRAPGPVLVVAHRDELIDQAARTIEALTGEPVAIEQGQNESWRERIVVGSVQSLRRPNRLGRLGKDRFSLIVVDEAHHATAASYRTVMDFFNCPVIGVTATPDRGDEKALGQVFDRVAYSMDIQDGIEHGWLVPFQGHRVVLDTIKLDLVGVTAGDLQQNELDEAMVQSVEGIAHETTRLSDGRQSIAFFPGVRSAELAARSYEKRGIPACVVSGTTPKDERRQLISDFRRGVYRVLANCQVATEGFDVPEVSCIIQGRPTLSRALYTQMIGRGGRTLPGIVDQYQERDASSFRRAAIAQSNKPDCMIIDCVGNSSRHSLISPADALGGNFDPEVVALAKKKTRQGENPLSALRQAQEELRAIAAKAKVDVKATHSRFDPFAVLGVAFTDEDRYAQRFGLKPMTDGQKSVLDKMGMVEKDMEGLSKRAASKLLDEISVRRQKGLATYKQVRLLEKFGVADAKQVAFNRAGQGLDYIASLGWGRRAVDPSKLQSILFGERQPGEDG
jgi:superfamily II DNA or RNA helicase